MALCVWLAPQSDFSERENRHLQTLEGIAAADDPMKAIADMYADQFPFRTSLAAMLSAVIACTLMISYGTAAMSRANSLPVTVEYTETAEEEITNTDIAVN